MKTTPSSTPERPELPHELMLAVLDYLSQPTVLALGGVSRAWRDAALSHRNYFFYIPLYPDRIVGMRRAPNPAPSFGYACRVLRRASKRGTRVALQINLLAGPRGRTLIGIWPDRLSAINWQSVIALDVTYSEDLEAKLYAALGQPAPFLEKLSLSFDAHVGISPRLPLPAHMLANTAPRLRTVCLSHVILGEEPVQVFQKATSVHITSNFDRSMRFWRHFPNCTMVNIVCTSTSLRSFFVDSHGTDIQELRIAYVNRRRVQLQLYGGIPIVPVLEVVGYPGANLSAHWDALGEPINLVLEFPKPPTFVSNAYLQLSNAYLRLTASSADQSRRIAVEVSSGISQDVSRSATRLSTIDLDHRTVRAFFELVEPDQRVFSVLDTLTITVHRPQEPIWPLGLSSQMHCPRLRQVRVRYIMPPIDYAFPIVQPDQIDALARAIEGGHDRTQLIALHLQGLTWKTLPRTSAEFLNTFYVEFDSNFGQ